MGGKTSSISGLTVKVLIFIQWVGVKVWAISWKGHQFRTNQIHLWLKVLKVFFQAFLRQNVYYHTFSFTVKRKNRKKKNKDSSKNSSFGSSSSVSLSSKALKVSVSLHVYFTGYFKWKNFQTESQEISEIDQLDNDEGGQEDYADDQSVSADVKSEISEDQAGPEAGKMCLKQ